MKLQLNLNVKLQVKLRMKGRLNLKVKHRLELNLKVKHRVNLKVLVDQWAKLTAPPSSQTLDGSQLLPTSPLEPPRKVRKSRLDIAN